jgi:uncharacterized membrane protein
LNRHLAIVALLLVSVGAYFRLAHLDRKVFWRDETHTALWISGLSRSDFAREAEAKVLLGPEDLKKYRSVNPGTGVRDTIRYLATVVPHHTPLYGVLARLWAGVFGDSVAAMRALPALLSLLGFPLIYWLARELFESAAGAWIALGLFAVSPFHVLYAQEARPYSLWIVATLLSGASLLRAMRLRTRTSFALYGVTTAVGLYSFLLFGFVLVGHGLYVLAVEGLRPTRAAVACAAAALGGLLVFTPWLAVIAWNLDAALWRTRWLGEPAEPVYWLGAAAYAASVAFVDFGEGLAVVSHGLTVVPALALIAWALVLLCRGTPRRVWAFVVAMIAPLASTLLLMDLALGGRRSGVARYLAPAHLGYVLAVAGALAMKIETGNLRRRLGFGFGALVLVASGIASCALSSRAETWWNKGRTTPDRAMARIIARTARPLLVADVRQMGDVISLSYDLGDAVRVLFAGDRGLPGLPDGFTEVFTLRPTAQRREQLGTLGYVLTPAHERGLWLVAKRAPGG